MKRAPWGLNNPIPFSPSRRGRPQKTDTILAISEQVMNLQVLLRDFQAELMSFADQARKGQALASSVESEHCSRVGLEASRLLDSLESVIGSGWLRV